MHSSDQHQQKAMVVGARTSERSVYFVLEDLARDRVQTTAHFLLVTLAMILDRTDTARIVEAG